MEAPEATKVCSKCPEGQQVKPISAFYKDKSRHDGLTPYCKQCLKERDSKPELVANRKAYKAAYHVQHAETINARSVQWGKDNPERMGAKNKRSREKRLLEQVAAGEREMPSKRRNRTQALDAGKKECSQCEVVKPLGDFYAWERSPDGVQSECKNCHDGRSQPIYPRDETISERKCSQCGATKLAAEFYDNPYVKSGIRAECKTCTSAANAAWFAANPDKRKVIANKSAKKARQDPEKRVLIYAATRRWQLAHPEAVKIHGARDREKARSNPVRMQKMRQKSIQWFRDRPGYRRAASQRRRALLKGATITDRFIDIAILYERDHGICTLCSYPVDAACTWPDKRMSTIDHAIPVTRGGPHSYTNTKLAHHYCNTLKNNRLETPELLASIRVRFELRYGVPVIMLPFNGQFRLF